MELKNNQYLFSDIPALDLAKEFGTPLYVYDTKTIAKQYKCLADAFSNTKIQIKYACKALSNINILRYIKSLGAGLDTVSLNEIELGLRAGFTPDQIIFTANSVSIDEIIAGAEKGVMINIDNISILEQFGNKFGNSIPISIRINPHIMAGGHQKISVGHIDSKFGISIHQIRHVERVVKSTNLNLVGLHMHTGSDILDVDVFLSGVEILLETATHFKGLQFIDLGSGFKVKYHNNDTETDIEWLGEELSKHFNNFKNEYGNPNMELWFEPGKYLVSKAGIFLTKVNVVKNTTATVFLGLNTGFNHLIRPMFYNSYHHIINISNPNGRERIYTVVGNICESDTFAVDRKIHEAHEGDILAFMNAGAYGYVMASNYNSRVRPAEVMIFNGKAHLISQGETFEDLIKNQIDLEIV